MDDILDYPEEFEGPFDAHAGLVAIKWFFLEAEARVYAARLREAGIYSFVSNANTTTMLPFGGGGIGLHVKVSDRSEAHNIIRELDKFNEQERVEESYHDYDEEDIAYLREVEAHNTRKTGPLAIIVVLIVLFSLIYAIINNYQYY